MSSEIVAGFDTATGLFSLPWWLAAVVAAFLVMCFALALSRVGVAGVLAGTGAVTIALLIVGGAWAWTTRSSDTDRAGQRHALQAQAAALSVRAIAPGSALACLDASAGEMVAASCEKALFVSPESAAAATSYVAARLALMTAGMDHARRTGAGLDAVLPGLRASLEDDRFGVVAQVLASAYGCIPDKCDMLAGFRNPARLRANLQDRAFDAVVARNAPAWLAHAASPAVASVTPAPPPVPVPVLNRSGPSPVPPGFNVPSAASIPPVSIMTPEGSPPPVAATETPPPATPRRAATRNGATRPPANAPPPPVQISPPAATRAQ